MTSFPAIEADGPPITADDWAASTIETLSPAVIWLCAVHKGRPR